MGAPVAARGAELRRWIALSCLVLGVLLFFHPVLLGEGVLYFRDISLNHYPTRVYTTPILRSGHLPLWNPYLSGGMPLAANPNNLILHPITLLFLILPVSVAFHASILLQVLLAGWGMFRWAREEGLREEAALVGGLTYAFSGGIASCGSLHNLLSSWAWVPLAAFCFARYRGTASRPALLGFGGALAVQLLAGDPVAAATTIVLAAASLLRGEHSGGRPGHGWHLGGALLAGVVLAGGLALVQMLPAREMLAASDRAGGISYPDAAAWSIPPVRLLELVVPFLYGDPTALKPSSYWGGMIFAKGYPFLLSIYIGAIPLLLAWGALGRRRDRRVHLLWGATLLSVATALGPEGFLYPLLYRHVPLVSSLRYPSRFLLPAFVFLACLAALGCDRLREEVASKRIGPVLVWILPASLALSAGAAFLGLSPHAIDRFVRGQLGIPSTVSDEVVGAIVGSLQRQFLHCVLLSAGLTLAVLLVRRSRMGTGLVSCLVVLAVGGDLISSNFHVNPVAPTSFYESAPPVLALARERGPEYRVYSDRRPRNFAVMAMTDSAWWGYYWDQISLRLGAALPHRIRMAYDKSTDLLSPRRVSDLATEIQLLDPERVRRLCQLASVGTLMTYREMSDPELVPAGQVSRSTNVPLRFYRNRSPLARAYLVSGAVPERRTALVSLTDPEFEPRSDVYLEGIDAPRGEPGEAGQARILEDLPERIVVSISAHHDGWLVLTDNVYPGWVAELDGKAVPIRRANYLFRAVQVGAGEHRIVFRYRPTSFLIGAAASLLTLAGGAAWALQVRRGRA